MIMKFTKCLVSRQLNDFRKTFPGFELNPKRERFMSANQALALDFNSVTSTSNLCKF